MSTSNYLDSAIAENFTSTYNSGKDDGLRQAEKLLLPKIIMAQDILSACLKIEEAVNGSVPNSYLNLINSENPYRDNSTLVQDAKTLANAITPGSCP